MRVRYFAGVALTLALAAPLLGAQQPTSKPKTSDQRILISKGEVSLPPETVYVARVDTLRLVRVDTVHVPRLFTRTRVDSVVVITPAPLPPVAGRGPLYFGLYGGMVAPTGNLNRLYSPGVQFGALAGWQQEGRAFGARLRADAALLEHERSGPTALMGTRSPVMFGYALDGKAALPGNASLQPYLVAGVGGTTFRGMALASKAGNALCNADGRFGCYTPARDTRWDTEFTYGFGGGFDFDIGGSALFLEGRANILQAGGARSWLIPVSLGARFF